MGDRQRNEIDMQRNEIESLKIEISNIGIQAGKREAFIAELVSENNAIEQQVE